MFYKIKRFKREKNDLRMQTLNFRDWHHIIPNTTTTCCEKASHALLFFINSLYSNNTPFYT